MLIAGLDHLVVLAAGAMLVSPWKPLILLVTLGLWAWVISTVYDKHAARFFLPRKTYRVVTVVGNRYHTTLSRQFFLQNIGQV